MIINRIWTMPKPWTFQIRYADALIKKYAGDGSGWADPFAGRSTFAQFRNDLNPEHGQPSCMEAKDFMENVGELSGAVFDPPYSIAQVSECYKGIGLKLGGTENATGGFPRVKDKIAKKVKPGGYVISFGWNSGGMGKGRGFEIVEILLLCHGGNHPDTICTVEKKLFDYVEED